MTHHHLQTGQQHCYNQAGDTIPCAESGQDGALRRGQPWPRPRFAVHDAVVTDRLTDLTWTRCANHAGFPLTWPEALDHVAEMNREQRLGHSDWRLPNRNELHSLVSYQTRRPALPEGHPFTDIFLGWYWSATTAAVAPAHAWYLHLEGARLFYGGKDQSFLVWPVRGRGNGLLPATGQQCCYDLSGRPHPCAGKGEDGEYRMGAPWPKPRFRVEEATVIDRLTGLGWRRAADIANGPVDWADALAAVAALEKREQAGWRLPNINELDSLVDVAHHHPALPPGHLFTQLQPAYWSATTSHFEPDWAWALYLQSGALGVGQKAGRHFHVWAVRDVPER